METMYATITSKGQLTVPVAARRALGLHEGQKVSVRVDGRSLVIDAPHDVRDTRERIREESIAQNTHGLVQTSGSGWAARVEEFRAKP